MDWEATVERVEAAYGQRLAALEAASAALTQEARRRLAAGPLAEAREIREAALGTASADQIRRMEEAVKDYGPSEEIYGAVNEAVAVLRSELEVYRAVVDVADRTADEAKARFETAAGVDTGRTSLAEVLEEEAAKARTVYEEAERVYESAVANRPQPVEPRKTGGENLGRFLEGLSSLAQGDEAAAERSASEIGRVREAALADAEAANRAAQAEYAGAVAAAGQARDTAFTAYQVASNEAARARAVATQTRAIRESDSEEYRTALTASRTAFVDLAKVTRIYQATELREVKRALLAGALSAAARLEERALSRVTREEARRAVESALRGGYGEARRAALKRLDVLQAAFDAAAETLDGTSRALEAAENANDALAVGAASALEATDETYLRALASADHSLVDALVSAARTWDTKKGRRKRSDIVETATAEHRRAEQVAREVRSRALARALPGLADPAASQLAVESYVYAGDSAEHLAEALGRYKSARSSADQRYRSQVVEAWKKDTTKLVRRHRDALAARDAALAALEHGPDALRELLDPPVSSASGTFDERAIRGYQLLEAEVRAGMLGLVP